MSDTKKMKNFSHPTAVSTLLIAVSLGLPAIAQTSSPGNAQVQTGTSSAPPANPNPSDNSTYATGQPLQTKSNEGFWGHMNPFARKKWVNRQLDPVKDRLNELDQLQAKNAKDIKDVDSRAQAGIHQAQSTADQASQTATTANNTATQANQMALQASNQTSQLHTTVSNLDQYQKVNDTEIRFRPGQVVLNAKAKEEKEENFHRIERRYGSFFRSFTVPNTVNTEGVKASYDAGVLRIELEKRAEAKPKQIKVQVGSGSKPVESKPAA